MKKTNLKGIYTLFLCLCLYHSSAVAESLPKWEMGVALAGQALNDYRGSRESQVQAYPVPIIIYRGNFLKADRDGVRAEFLANKLFEFNVSAETALNGSSGDNRLRQGMPELDSAIELGPSFNINITGDDFSEGWQFRLPVRAVFTFSPEGVGHIGFNVNPRFTFSKLRALGAWNYKSNIGLLYSSQKYHDYYYTVDEQFVTNSRPEFQAKSGFSGYYFKNSLTQRHNNFLFGLSLRYDNLSGAVFEGSPLVETEDYFAISFAIAWLGWRSDK